MSSTLPDHEVDRSRSGAAVRVAPRDAYWDHVRLLAIALVVVGHSIEKLDEVVDGGGPQR